MKRFRFTLDSVKRIRADAEQAAQAELARTMGTHAAAIRARDARRQSLEAARRRMRDACGPAYALVAADLERRAARLRLDGAEEQRTVAEAEVDRSRERLVETSRALEIVERLEQRRRETHRAAQLREEEAIVQEITEARAARATQLRRRA